MRIIDAQKGLDFQFLVAQGVAKGEGDCPQEERKSEEQEKCKTKNFNYFSAWNIYNRRVKFYHGNYRTAL